MVMGMEAQIESITGRMQEARKALDIEHSRVRVLELELQLSLNIVAKKEEEIQRSIRT